jgi:EAL domain-containing protein (putative c-di-GMP-specific phosphodiesterase class I)
MQRVYHTIYSARAFNRFYILAPKFTDSAVIADQTRTLMIIGHLNVVGVRVTVDDSGTGHSSRAYLREHQVNRLN